MKPLVQSNIDKAIARIEKAQAENDLQSLEDGRELLKTTLDSIRLSDRATYDKYVRWLPEPDAGPMEAEG